MNNYEMLSLAHDLFDALDDTILAQYYDYQKGIAEYPSKLAINALQRAINYHGFSSKALNKMLDTLAEDISITTAKKELQAFDKDGNKISFAIYDDDYVKVIE